MYIFILSQITSNDFISCFDFDRKSMEIETTTRSEFPNRGKTIVEQILASKEINKSTRVGL